MSTHSTALIEARDITRRFGAHDVLSRVSLTVNAGDIVTVIGPNGSGKSSLLKLLLGLDEPDEGSIRRKAGLRVGYMPQKISFSPQMPISVKYFLSLNGSDVLPLAERIGITHLLQQQMHSLSGGELQRVMLARTFLTSPELLVLDEPAQGVDINGQGELYALITELANERNAAVLMVSHDLHLVMASTTHVICLNHHICCEGHPQAISRDPAFAALFGDHVAQSLALYVHHHDHTHGPDGEVQHAHCGHH